MRALIVVDAQYDFMPGGSLAVPEGDKIVEKIKAIRSSFDMVVFTQDWHPANHCSFKENGGLWPAHCVQDTHGAQIHEELFDKVGPHGLGDYVVAKGNYQDVDSYSGFWDNDKKHQTSLDSLLKTFKVDSVYICGLATNFCVKFTALDAVDAGYKTYLLVDCCKGLDINPGDVDKAIEEMNLKGVQNVFNEA